MARDGDPAKEPGNPDGCRISKKQVRQIGTSLAGLAEMFVRASNLIESSVRSITSQLANIKVGSGKAKSEGGKEGATGDFSGQEKLARKIASGAFRKLEQAKQKTIENEISAYYESEKSQIKAQEEANAIAEEAKIDAAKKEAIQSRIDSLVVEKYRNALSEQKERQLEQEAKANKDSHDAAIWSSKNEELSRKAASEAFRKLSEKKAKEQEDAQREANQAQIDARNREKIEAKILELQVKSWSKALSEQKKRQAEQEALEAARHASEEKAARDAEAQSRAKFFSDQEREILKQAPIAYGLGKAFGFLTGSILKIGSNIAPQISKAAKGLFAPKEMAPEESANLERQYLRYEGAPKREERAKRRQETPVDPLAIREQEYNARKGVSKPPRGFSNGGQAKGTDTVPAMLTPGEIVVNKKASKKYGPLLDAINSGKVKGFARGGVVGPVAGAIGAVGRGAAGAASGFASGLDASGYTAAANAIRGLSRAIPAATSGFQALSIATIGPIDIFNKLVGFVGSFVEAVNPALMQQLSMAFKDLQAVIGVGLQPIIAAAIPIIRAFADKLQPVMQALMPTFDKLAQSMIKMSGPIITILIEAFGALEPIITQISSVIEAWAGILAFLTPIISSAFKEIVYRVISLSTTFQWLIGKIISWVPGTGDLGKNLMESADASQKTADAYYSGASAVQKAIKADVKRGASAGAAARQASFTGISEFGRNLMQQAFSSSTQAAALKTAEYSEKTYNELAKMNAQLGRADPAAPARGVRGGP